MVSRLKKVPLKEVWIHEARDFTTWLENNLDILSEQLGYHLSLVEREKPVGPFSVDIHAEGPNGDSVVIENQLEKTDHDHLGKIITYLSNLNAKTAIWITSTPRLEHVNAINWLNEISPPGISFFLVKVEAYKIDGSDPAPLFTVICSPSEEARQIGKQKEHLAEGHLRRLRLEFWKGLLDRAKIKTDLHSNVSPSKDNWVAAGAGKSGMEWRYSITMDKGGAVELFISRPNKAETDEIFGKLLENRDMIDKEFGEPLVWDKVENRRVCRIESLSNIGGLKDAPLWDRIQDDMIDRMVRLEKTLKPMLLKIK